MQTSPPSNKENKPSARKIVKLRTDSRQATLNFKSSQSTPAKEISAGEVGTQRKLEFTDH